MTGSYSVISFYFSSPLSLTPGNYYLSLTSNTATAGSQQYFIKGADSPFISQDGSTTVSATIASATANPLDQNLTLSKTATSSVSTSGSITYTLGLGNSGGTTSTTSATVKDKLPAGVVATAVTAGTGVSSVSCGSLPSTAGATLTCSVTLSAGLAPGANTGTAAFTISATAPSSSGSITNYASVDATGGSSPTTPSSSCTTTSCASAGTTVTSPSNITLSKSATATVITNGSISYTLGLGNSGGSASGTSATVKDVLPSGVVATAVTAGTGVSGVTCGTLPSAAGATLTCTVTLSSALAAGAANGAAAFTITATAPATSGAITNYASVDPTGGASPATPGGSCATTSCGSAATTVNTPVNVTLSKTGPASASTGASMTYTLGLGNSGGTASGTSVTVKDALPAGVIATAVTAGTGVSSVSCGTLPSAAGATLTCTVTLSSALAAGAANGAAAFTITATAPASAGSITNYASVDSTGGSSPATPGASCSTTSCGSAGTTVTAASNLTLTKSATTTVLTNGSITYTLGLGNSGGVTSGTSATIKEALPAGVVATAVTAGTGVSSVNCGSLPSAAGATLTCTVTLSSGLAAGAANGSAAFTITATAPATSGAITNYASVDPTGGSSPATPGSSCATTSCGSAATTVNAPVNITLSKAATASVLTNGSITYTLGLGNSGGTASGTSATVKDVLPAGVVATAVTAGTGVSAVSCGTLPSAAGTTLTCTVTLSSGLAAGAANGAAAFTITATAPATSGAITNYASVDPTGGSSPATPGSSCATTSCGSAATTVNTPVNITLSKSGPASVSTGGSMTYTLGLGNSGGTASGTTATVKDVLPAGVVATAVTAGTGVSSVSCGTLPSSAGATLTCTVTLSSALAAGAANGTAAFTLTTTAPASAGAITNYASVDPTGGASPATPGSSCATTSCASAATTVTAASNLTLSKSASSTALTNGSITYTLGLGNSGAAASGTSATVSDSLPSGVVATAVTAGTGVSAVNCGSLPSAAGATLTCSVTLSSGLAAGAANGSAAFTITATAPSSSGSITNYASVDPTGGTSPATPGASCTSTSCGSAATTVTTPSNITLSKSAAATAYTGGSLTYTLGLGNSGGTISGTSATVKEALPAGVVATAVTAGTGVSSVSCGTLPSTAGATLTCSVTLSSGLAAGVANGTAAFTLTATAPSSAGAITNYASVDPTGGSSPATPGASCSTTSCGSAATTVSAPPALSITKTTIANPIVGVASTYSITVSNSAASGTTTAPGATLLEAIPAGLTLNSIGGGSSGWTCTKTDGTALSLPTTGALTVKCVTTSTIAAGASATAIPVSVTPLSAAVGQTLSTIATVDTTGGGSPATPPTSTSSCSSPNCAYNSVTNPISASLTLSKAVTTAGGAGDTGAYTVTVKNGGPTATYGAIGFTDTLPTGMTFGAVTSGSFTCSASGQTVSCATTSTIASGATAAVAYSVTIASTATGNLLNQVVLDPSQNGGDVSITSGAVATDVSSLSALNGATGAGTNGRAAQASMAVQQGTLSVSKTLYSVVSGSSTVTSGLSSYVVKPGDVLTYRIRVTETGGAYAATTTLTETVPTSTIYTAANISTDAGLNGSAWTASGSSYTRSVTATKGATQDVYFTVTVTSDLAAGVLTVANSVTSSASGSCVSGCSTSNATAPRISVTKAAGQSSLTSLTRGTFTVTVSNQGGSATTSAVKFTDTLPTGLTFVSATGSGTTCSASGQVVSCTVSSTIAAGASIPVTYTVLASGAAQALVTNSVLIDPTQMGGDPRSNTDTSSSAATPSTAGNATVSASGYSAKAAMTIAATTTSSLSGKVTKKVPGGSQGQAGVTVTVKNAAGQVVATAVTAADGSYVIDGLVPGASYTLVFTTPDGKTVTALAQNSLPSLNGTAAGNSISNPGLAVGSLTTDQNAIVVDPAGVVYNSITRAPLANSQVWIFDPSGAPVPNSLLDLGQGTANGTATAADGVYKLFLKDTAASGVYTLKVVPPGCSLGAAPTYGVACPSSAAYKAGATNGASAVLPPQSSAFVPMLGGGVDAIQTQATAPTGTQPTTYYMSVNFTFSPNNAAGTSDGITNNHIAVDPAPALSVAKSAMPALVPNQPSSYNITVSNGAGGTSAPGATVLEKIPLGLTLNSIAGAGWSCTNTDGSALALPITGGVTVKCVRTTPIPTGSSAPALAVVVTPDPSSVGKTLATYASVDPTGGGSPQPPQSPASCTPSSACAENGGGVTPGSATLTLQKVGSAQTVELGDSLSYTLTLRMLAGTVQTGVAITDTLPRGFRYVPNTVRLTLSGTQPRQASGDKNLGVTGFGPTLNFTIGRMVQGDIATITYRVRVGAGSQQGDGINTAQAHTSTGFASNVARYRVQIGDGVFAMEGCVVGKVYLDCDGSGVQNGKKEMGIPGVRVYLENGNFAVSDSEGKYSFCGVPAMSHVLKVDRTTLPQGSILMPSSNRNLGDEGSLFIDLKFGEMHRADFIEGSCAPQVVDEVQRRRDNAVGQRDGAAQSPASSAVLKGASKTFSSKEAPRTR